MDGDFVGDSQYVTAKTSVWWDIENCQVPRSCDVHAIAQNISSALVNLKYCGPVFISAYGDTNKIPNSVQQALSSTGITLNHVPAGVKDASDKKILVDMLFWAVDNPAPANYLLISGDRDFSNALHQLRMRRYNILLAQPHKASRPLVAAAKSVWLWTSLLAGGPPLSEAESQNLLGNNSITSTSNAANVLSDGFPAKLPVNPPSETPHLGNQKNPHVAKGYDNKQKGKPVRRTLSQPNGARSEPVRSQEFQCNPNNFQPNPYIPKFATIGSTPDISAGNSNFTWSDVTHSQGNHQNHFVQPPRPNIPSTQPVPAAGSAYPPNLRPHAPLIPARPNGVHFSSPLLGNFPDIGNMSIHPNNFRNTPNVHPPPPQRRNGEVKHESKKKSLKPVMTNLQNGFPAQNMPSVHQETQNNRYTASHEYSSSSSSVGMSVSSSITGVWGTPGCPRPSDYVQGLIGVILLALNTLENEKLIPTESNITDCIRYGDSKHQNTDVKKALESAVDQQMVVKQNVGAVQLYVGKNGKLWKCVNPISGNPKDVQKSTWDEIQAFLTSPTGKSAILASRCRYEAGTILKSLCLKHISLGDILQILNMVISIKKWIIHHQSGWQPLNITLTDVDCNSVSASAT